MKKIILFILLMFVPFFANADIIEIETKGNWKLENKNSDHKIHFINENEIVILSNAYSSKSSSFSKYDKNKNLVLDIKYTSDICYFFDYVIDNEGNIIIVGRIEEDNHALMLKYDKNGNLLWEKKYKNTGPFILVSLKEDNIVTFGYDTALTVNKYIKLDKDGKIIEEKEIDTYTNLFIAEKKNNGNIVSMCSENYDYICEFDLEGNTINKTNVDPEEGYTIYEFKSSNDGNLYVQYSLDQANENKPKIYTRKYDKNNNILWEIKNDNKNIFQLYNKVIPTNDGGFINLLYLLDEAKVEQNSFEMELNIYKYDKDGKLESNKIINNKAMMSNLYYNTINEKEYIIVHSVYENDSTNEENSLVFSNIHLNYKNNTKDNNTNNDDATPLVYILIALALIVIVLFVIYIMQKKNKKDFN